MNADDREDLTLFLGPGWGRDRVYARPYRGQSKSLCLLILRGGLCVCNASRAQTSYLRGMARPISD